MKIALIRPDRIGDAVIGSCAIKDILRVFSDAEIFWITRSEVAPLFSGENFPATSVGYDPGSGVSALTEKLRACAPDAVVHLTPDAFTERAAEACGCPVRIGFRASFRGALTATPGVAKERGEKHEAEYARDLLRLLPGFSATNFGELETTVRPEKSDDSEIPAGDFFVLHTGAHGAKVRVPESVWAIVADELREKTGYTPIVIGAEPGANFHGAIDLRGKSSLVATAKLLSRAKLCLSRDSGPAHLAAALGCPTVCVFIENSPKMGPVRWTPIGRVVRVVVPPPSGAWDRLFPERRRRANAKNVRPGKIVAAALDAIRAASA